MSYDSWRLRSDQDEKERHARRAERAREQDDYADMAYERARDQRLERENEEA